MAPRPPKRPGPGDVPKGLGFGQRQALQQAQAVQPMAGRPDQSSATAARMAAAGGGGRGPAPGQIPGLDTPTLRPDEPVTTGLPTGPGGGPDVLGLGGQSEELDILRYLYMRFPVEGLRRLIEFAETQQPNQQFFPEGPDQGLQRALPPGPLALPAGQPQGDQHVDEETLTGTSDYAIPMPTGAPEGAERSVIGKWRAPVMGYAGSAQRT